MEPDAFKRAAAEAAIAEIANGMIVGLGTGSTAFFAVSALGRRVAEGLRVIGIPTSERTAAQARCLKIPLATLREHPQIDVAIDGADEVEKGSLGLIKGKGGALLREKIVASASRRFLVIVDQSKLVDRLGQKGAVPVEVSPFGWPVVARALENLRGKPSLRLNPDGSEFLTDGGNYILDCSFGPIDNAETLSREIDSIPGVLEHGLFLKMASKVFVGAANGVVQYPK
ncbi:MAG TPA: ribose-5-phosphate isomerase RpiA [Bryobacteraceae bacterium]|nr:ribose-5-phosphate isomerase RpiA [Bryobacteraceae bacterium]